VQGLVVPHVGRTIDSTVEAINAGLRSLTACSRAPTIEYVKSGKGAPRLTLRSFPWPVSCHSMRRLTTCDRSYFLLIIASMAEQFSLFCGLQSG
jgi:hypothetical protein